MDIKIIPAILEQEWGEIERKLALVHRKTAWVQLDVSDGDFTPMKTWGEPNNLDAVSEEFLIEMHLMVSRPWEVVGQWLHPRVKRVAVHWEAFADAPELFTETAQQVRKHGAEYVCAVNPGTPWQPVRAHRSVLDGVMFLGVTPGKSGQEFQPAVLDDIAALRAEHPDGTIAVDGGVNDTTASRIVSAGANRLISSSFIFSFNDPAEGIARLQQAAVEQ